jgi:hypothetical protein
MSLQTIVRRATAMPDSDQAENNRLTQQVAVGWTINNPTIRANATFVTFSSCYVVVNGVITLIASAATGAFVGTLATSTTGAFIHTIAAGGTISSIVCSGTTLAAIAFPTIPVSQLALGMTIIACTATGFNGGTNSVADTSYTVTHLNFLGPANIACTTESWTNVPG